MKGPKLHKRPEYRLLKQSDTISFFHMQMPRWLFCDQKYAPLSLESKVAYTFLLNRFQLSKMNGWINDQSEVFIIFPREKLAEEMGVSYRKAIACMGELLSAGLIWEHRLGRGNANHIYMAAVELSEESASRHVSAPFVSRSAETAGLENGADCGEAHDDADDEKYPQDQDVHDPHVKECKNGISRHAGSALADLQFSQGIN